MPSATSSDIPLAHPQSQENDARILSLAKDAITYFLTETKIDVPSMEMQRDIEVEKHVEETAVEWGLEHLKHPHLLTGMLMAATGFRHIPDLDARIHIAFYTALVTAIDVQSEGTDTLPFETFHHSFCAGTLPTDTGLFGRLSENLKGMWRFYSGFAASAMVGSTLQFINGCILEKAAADMKLLKGAQPFVEYRRALVGIPEAYAMLIWDKARFPDVTAYVQAIPDVMLYIDYVNDIFSFYKEEIAGEKDNYIGGRAIAGNKPTSEVLRDVVDDTVLAVHRIRDVLGEGNARDAWESFAAGFVQFHAITPRYCLKEILQCQYYVDE